MRLYFICLIFIFNLPACNNSGGEDTPVPDNDSAKAPVIMGLDARIPGAEEPRLYIDALGKNLDSRDLQATLINDSQEITLEVAAQSFDNARFYLPDSADVAEGLFNLFISNAYGQTHGSVTVLKGDKGDQGDTGPTGPPGEKGDPGSP
ncbi:MAG: hypothetical protein AMJ55_07485, partial [Gammaproteobacteria bacterium SG8_15]